MKRYCDLKTQITEFYKYIFNVKLKNDFLKKSAIHFNFILLLFVAFILSNCKEDKPKTLELGQTFQGGIIFFLDDNGEHGLIAATTDQHTNIQWCTGTCQLTNANATAPGSGKTNTEKIVQLQKDINYAANICDKLVHNGYDDWYLPSKDELNYLFIQKEAGRVGNFLEEEYWSSTESNADRAWLENMGNGSTHAEIKINGCCIRAIRAF